MCDRAIIASESVKGNYRIRCNEFNDAMYEKMMREQQIVNTMVESLNKEEFCVYLQPKIDMEKSKIIGAEALVRWKHPELERQWHRRNSDIRQCISSRYLPGKSFAGLVEPYTRIWAPHAGRRTETTCRRNATVR